MFSGRFQGAWRWIARKCWPPAKSAEQSPLGSAESARYQARQSPRGSSLGRLRYVPLRHMPHMRQSWASQGEAWPRWNNPHRVRTRLNTAGRRPPPRFPQRRGRELRRRRRRRGRASADHADVPARRRARARLDRGRHFEDRVGPGDQDRLAQAAGVHPQPDSGGNPGRECGADVAICATRSRSPSAPSRASRTG